MATATAEKTVLDMESMMDVYLEFATPGAPHELLSRMAGNWNVKSLCWMQAGGEPMEHTGSSEQRMILGGRFLQQTFEGDMMGTPFSGIGFTGYDNYKRKFVSTWMDSMGTGIYHFEGDAGPDGRTITQSCDYNDPVRGPLKWRHVTTIVDGDTLKFEMFTTGESGREEKMADMTYIRRK